MDDDKTGTHDRALGMDARITRRDFLNSTLIGSGALLAPLSPAELLARAMAGTDDWTGYGGVGDYAASNGNTLQVMLDGHLLREPASQELPPDVVDTGETYDCVIVGGGISGLAAALIFGRRARPGSTCLVLDNHPIFGGEAKRNELDVDGYRLMAHQGSAYHFAPYPMSFIGRFYESIGLKDARFEYQPWGGSRRPLATSNVPYGTPGMNDGQYGFFFGAKYGRTPGEWVIDPVRRNLEGAPLSDASRDDFLKVLRAETKPGFERPKWDGDAISRALDAVTLEDHLMALYGVSRESVRTFLSDEGGGFGLMPDALSAMTRYAPDFLHPMEPGEQMFPDGNSGFARMIVKTLLPRAIGGPDTLEGVCRGPVDFTAFDRPGAPVRIRLSSLALSVKHDGDPMQAGTVSVGYRQGARVYRVRARSAILAGGSWTSRHIVRDLPPAHAEAYAQFHRSPAMIVNIAVRNWRFLERLGISGARWFEGVGSFLQMRRVPTFGAPYPAVDPDKPAVITLKVLFPTPGLSTEEQGHRGRAGMLATPFQEYERRIRAQFDDMFARAGFDNRRDIAGIILNRWGHAYVSPQVGWYYGIAGKPAPRDVLRGAPFGRLAFANTDLAGNMDHRSSILEADRAVGQLLDQVLA
jgi:spermidine dehydrogenase